MSILEATLWHVAEPDSRHDRKLAPNNRSRRDQKILLSNGPNWTEPHYLWLLFF